MIHLSEPFPVPPDYEPEPYVPDEIDLGLLTADEYNLRVEARRMKTITVEVEAMVFADRVIKYINRLSSSRDKAGRWES